jgi:hypothetical protein
MEHDFEEVEEETKAPPLTITTDHPRYDSDLPAPLPLFSSNEPQTAEALIRDTNPPKTGTGLPMMTKRPEFIEEVEPYEPIAPPQENILEECLRRETERVAH